MVVYMMFMPRVFPCLDIDGGFYFPLLGIYPGDCTHMSFARGYSPFFLLFRSSCGGGLP